jgi:hypothetical protein
MGEGPHLISGMPRMQHFRRPPPVHRNAHFQRCHRPTSHLPGERQLILRPFRGAYSPPRLEERRGAAGHCPSLGPKAHLGPEGRVGFAAPPYENVGPGVQGLAADS